MSFAALADEYHIHCAVVAQLRFMAHPKTIYFHAANGESRSARTGARLKKMAVRPGVADICLTLPTGQSAYLEIKAAKGRQTPEQRAFEAHCKEVGVPYAIARSPEEAKAILTSWGALRETVARAA